VDSLQEKIKAARERALAAQKESGGTDNWWRPEANKELHFRILEWPGHDECWIEYTVHYVDSPKGVKVLPCCGDGCYSCMKIADLASAGDKESMEIARRSKRVDKVVMQLVDWDRRERGPLMWEPKYTQSCNQWMQILSILSNPDYRRKVYAFKEGRLLTMLLGSEKRKIRGRDITMFTLKSLIPGTSPFPVLAGKTKDGYAIELQMRDNTKKRFPLFDLNQFMSEYVESDHAEAWGETVMSPIEETSTGGETLADESFSELTDPGSSDASNLEYADTDAGQVETGGGDEFLSMDETPPEPPKPQPRPAQRPAQQRPVVGRVGKK
jgi:hypothetical protein